MSSSDTIQGKDGEDDKFDSDEDSNKDDEEESKESRVAEADSAKVSGADRKGGALMAKGLPEPPLTGERIYFL